MLKDAPMTAKTLPLNFIAADPDVRGGRPIVAGTVVTVSDIAAAVNFRGKTPAELADELNLSPAQVYAALAYYHAHRDEIDAQIRADRDQAEALRDMQARRAWIESLKPQIAAFCAKWKITQFALFGSVLRDDFRVDSDVDVLVDFAPDARLTLFDVFRMEEELKSIFGRDVDLLDRRAVQESDNPRRQRAILDSAEVLHAA